MTEREGIVKGQIGEQREGRKVHEKINAGILAIGLLMPWSSSVRADDELRLPESPRITATLQPTARSEIKITPQKEVAPTEFSLEEHDPFSQEGMLENFIAGYEMMTEAQKKEVRKRVTTDPKTGATIYVSKRTAESYMPDLQDGQADELLRAVSDNLLYPIPEELNKQTFVILDQNPKNGNETIGVTEMGNQSPLSQQEYEFISNKKKNDATPLGGLVYERIRQYSSAQSTMWRNGEKLSMLIDGGFNWMTDQTLNPFSLHVVWQEGQKSQFVLTNGLTIMAVYDPPLISEVGPNFKGKPEGTRVIKPVPLDMPILIGDRQAIFKKNLSDYLQLMPEMFHDPKAVGEYLQTGDPTKLIDVELFPDTKDPAFFAIKGGKYRLEEHTLKRIKEAAAFMQRVDPAIFDMLNRCGLRIICPEKSFCEYDFGEKIPVENTQATFLPEFGSITLNQTYRAEQFEFPEIAMAGLLINESYGISICRYIRLMGNLPQSLDAFIIQGIGKVRLLNDLTYKYWREDKITEGERDALLAQVRYVGEYYTMMPRLKPSS